MASNVGGNLSRIESGPCKLTYKSAVMGHTMDGVKMSVKPDLRERKVDEYGTTVVDLVHQGDSVTIKTTLAEKTVTVIQTVYQWGYSVSAYVWGIGKTLGRKGSDLAGQMTLHPIEVGAATTDDVVWWKAVVSEAGEIAFGVITADRVFEVTWTCLPDETKADGQVFGTIGVAAS